MVRSTCGRRAAAAFGPHARPRRSSSTISTAVRDDGIGLDPHRVPRPGLHVDLAAVGVDHEPLARPGRDGRVDLLDECERREGAGSQGEEHGRSFQLTEETSAAA